MINQEYENLVNLLKVFKNRPHHLAKYLSDNDAFSDSFLDKLNNNKLSNISEDDTPDSFVDINHMNEYFNSLIDGTNFEEKKSFEKVVIDINFKLNKCLKEERYEEAVNIRNYMEKNNIPRI